jgi:hypothetical protein
LTFEFFHRAGDKFFGFADGLHHDLNIHRGLARLARALAVHAMLSDHSNGIGKAVEADGEASADGAHLEFMLFNFVATIVKNTHPWILSEKENPPR